MVQSNTTNIYCGTEQHNQPLHQEQLHTLLSLQSRKGQNIPPGQAQQNTRNVGGQSSNSHI